MKPSISTAAHPSPIFRVHGELSHEAIAALARLLIDHARRELEAERAEGQVDAEDHQHQAKECQV